MKIAIVGTKPDTWHKFPQNEGWELWRFGRVFWEQPPVPDKWFELHRPEINNKKSRYVAPGYKKFIETAVTFDKFPFEDLTKEFGRYFFNGGQISWIMAYAITKNPQTIGLWGVDPSKPAHYAQAREIHHFAQVARSRGIEVVAPADKILNPPLLYAVDILYAESTPPFIKQIIWNG